MGILQAIILEWVAMPSSRGFPSPGFEPRSPALQMDSLPSQPPGDPKNTGVGSLSLLQGIFLTWEFNQGLLPCRLILYQLSHKGSPRILEWVAYLFSRGSSWPGNQTGVSCIAGRFFTNWAVSSVQPLSRVWLFATPSIAARQASLSITNSQSLLSLTSIESVMLSSHLILCRPLLLLPPIPPSIRVFSNESRKPKDEQ